MWGGTLSGELKQIRKAKLQTKRDALFDEIQQQKREYQKTVTEREFVEQQIQQGEERRQRLKLEISQLEEDLRSGRIGREGYAEQQKRILEIEHSEGQDALLQARHQELGEQAEEQQGNLQQSQRKLRGNERQINGITVKGSSAKSVFDAPTKFANKLSGGSAGLVFGLMAVVVFLMFAITPAVKGQSKSRLILASEALAGTVDIKPGG